MTKIKSISGGADAAMAAAIAAAVAHVEESDAETKATRPPVPTSECVGAVEPAS